MLDSSQSLLTKLESGPPLYDDKTQLEDMIEQIYQVEIIVRLARNTGPGSQTVPKELFSARNCRPEKDLQTKGVNTCDVEQIREMRTYPRTSYSVAISITHRMYQILYQTHHRLDLRWRKLVVLLRNLPRPLVTLFLEPIAIA